MSSLSNEEFLSACFGNAAPNAHVTGFDEDPGDLESLGLSWRWAGNKFSRTHAHTLVGKNSYFTISTFRDDPADGKARRRKALFERTYVIVVDDVGTKVTDTSKLPDPSWKLETSPGNFQLGYVLELPETDAGRVNALLDGMVALGLCPDGSDPGMKGVTRYVRLPQGINNKAKYGPGGFACLVHEWEPSRRYTIEELAQPWGITLPPAGTVRTPAQRMAIAEEDDEIFRWLSRWGMIHSKASDGDGYLLECPWIDDHTGRADSGTAYWLGGGFKCHHGHCQDKGRRDVERWVDKRLREESGGLVCLSACNFPPIPGRTANYSLSRAGEYLGELWHLLVLGHLVTSQDVDRMHLARVPEQDLDTLLRGAKTILGADTGQVRREIRRARKKIETEARRAHREETERALGAIVPMPESVLAPVSLEEANAAMAAQLAGMFPGQAGASSAL